MVWKNKTQTYFGNIDAVFYRTSAEKQFNSYVKSWFLQNIVELAQRAETTALKWFISQNMQKQFLLDAPSWEMWSVPIGTPVVADTH